MDFYYAAVDNTQVRWVLEDSDDYEFYKIFMEAKQVRDMMSDLAVDKLHNEHVKIERFADKYDSFPDWLPF